MSSWETGIRYLLIDHGVQRIVSECVSHVCANWRSLKKMLLTALVSLTTHRTRTDNIYTCITWITMVLLSRQVSVVLSSCILWIKPSFTSKGKESGVDLQFCSTICVVVCKRQLSYLDANAVCVACRDDDADTPVRCASGADDFIKDVSNAVPIPFCCYSHTNTQTHVWAELEF